MRALLLLWPFYPVLVPCGPFNPSRGVPLELPLSHRSDPLGCWHFEAMALDCRRPFFCGRPAWCPCPVHIVPTLGPICAFQAIFAHIVPLSGPICTLGVVLWIIFRVRKESSGHLAALPGRSGIIKILIFPMGLYSYLKNLNVSGSKPQGNDYCKNGKEY